MKLLALSLPFLLVATATACRPGKTYCYASLSPSEQKIAEDLVTRVNAELGQQWFMLSAKNFMFKCLPGGTQLEFGQDCFKCEKRWPWFRDDVCVEGFEEFE